MTTAAGAETIEVRVSELQRLFNSIDPSPFHDKDLDADAEEFIVGWARDAHRDAALALLVHLDRAPGPVGEEGSLHEAVNAFFGNRAARSRRRLRTLLRLGRTSLLIGFVFVGACIGIGDLVARSLADRPLGDILRESVLIGGWVALWRPLEIFLYDWWPIRAEARLYDRLARMPVRIRYRGEPAAA